MSPLDIDTALGWRGRTVLDRDGDRIGKLGEILLDSETDAPAWGGVRTGLFGRKESYLPLDELQETGDDELQAPFEKRHVVGAPSVDPEVAMTPEEEATLFRHYGREEERAEPAAHATPGEREERAEPAAYAAPPEPGDRDEGEREQREGDEQPPEGEDKPEMIRSEEEIRTGTTGMRPTERVRLKKVLVTDEVKRTVPVRREEVRLETEPPPEGTIESVEDVPDDERR